MPLLKNRSINDKISSHRSQEKLHNFEQIEAYELHVSRKNDFINLTNNSRISLVVYKLFGKLLFPTRRR